MVAKLVIGVCSSCVRYQKLEWGKEVYSQLKEKIEEREQKTEIHTECLSQSEWKMIGERASCRFTNSHYKSITFFR